MLREALQRVQYWKTQTSLQSERREIRPTLADSSERRASCLRLSHGASPRVPDLGNPRLMNTSRWYDGAGKIRSRSLEPQPYGYAKGPIPTIHWKERSSCLRLAFPPHGSTRGGPHRNKSRFTISRIPCQSHECRRPTRMRRLPSRVLGWF